MTKIRLDIWFATAVALSLLGCAPEPADEPLPRAVYDMTQDPAIASLQINAQLDARVDAGDVVVTLDIENVLSVPICFSERWIPTTGAATAAPIQFVGSGIILDPVLPWPSDPSFDNVPETYPYRIEAGESHRSEVVLNDSYDIPPNFQRMTLSYAGNGIGCDGPTDDHPFETDVFVRSNLVEIAVDDHAQYASLKSPIERPVPHLAYYVPAELQVSNSSSKWIASVTYRNDLESDVCFLDGPVTHERLIDGGIFGILEMRNGRVWTEAEMRDTRADEDGLYPRLISTDRIQSGETHHEEFNLNELYNIPTEMVVSRIDFSVFGYVCGTERDGSPVREQVAISSGPADLVSVD